MDVLREQVHTLKERLAELVADFKRFSDEMKTYRHEMRTENQRIYIDIERLSQEWGHIEKDLKHVQDSIVTIVLRIDALDRQKFQVQGGVTIAKFLWGGVGAILLLVIDFAIRKFAG